MNLNSTKVQINEIFNLIILFIFFLIFTFMNDLKFNLVLAGQTYSEVKKTDSSKKLFDSSETKIDILREQIDNLSRKKNEILKEINILEEKLKEEKLKLLFNLKNKNKKNSDFSESFLKFKISFLKDKLSFLTKSLNEITLEQISLELKLRKKLNSVKK
ncbi:MAG: effector protein [Candidatus Phytoplasma stylosanthis]|uniref:effector protein n=1 Tax=Candidatus Phytoplasma stylosanthis TaxID=2798314 RepID=UPI00293A2832|nr:effector protein [Candidatus Phytoplasma stylosanthis]MDV3168058.1 effector protein [Candidatus Phytoplasma stylosanthis]MDV3171000.1 effector protein [Candidatus Phytoplasma stylosanthis]MDV3173918.1 effector protein [Candidatus Phytoplasma stylosanthis]MDV3174363.1 effector protein [Candidatus Phytoplasma stylosanthis]MDV3202500.1 effector protein [Candidatus Phytoplasma stylosanthis]